MRELADGGKRDLWLDVDVTPAQESEKTARAPTLNPTTLNPDPDHVCPWQGLPRGPAAAWHAPRVGLATACAFAHAPYCKRARTPRQGLLRILVAAKDTLRDLARRAATHLPGVRPPSDRPCRVRIEARPHASAPRLCASGRAGCFRSTIHTV